MRFKGTGAEDLIKVADTLGLTPDEFNRRKHFLGLDAETCELLQDVSERLSRSHDDAVDEFYSHLGRFKETAELLERTSSLATLKKKQSRHFATMVQGRYDWDYLADRLRVGLTHQRVGIAPSYYTGAYAKYLGASLRPIWQSTDGEPDRFLAALEAVLKAAFLDLTLVLEAYFDADRMALAQSDSRLRRAKRIANFTIFDWNPESGAIAVSPEDVDALGVSPRGDGATVDQLLNQVHPGDRGVAEAALARARTERAGFQFECRRVLKNGDVRCIEVTGAVDQIDAGSNDRGVLVLRDVTEAREARDRLTASNRRFWTLMDRAGDAIIVACRRGMITECNARFLELVGRTRAQVMNSPVSAFHAEGERGEIEMLMRQVRVDGALVREGDLLGPDGSLVPVELSLTPARWSGQDQVLLIYRDLTERRRAEADKLKLSHALEHTGDSVMITDENGCIEYVNQSFERLTGYTASEALGNRPSLVQSGRHDRTFYQRLWETIRRGEAFRETFVNRRKDGTVYHEAKTITPLRDSNGRITHYIAIGRDATALVRMQDRLNRLAYQDVLTGLPNRAMFSDELTERVAALGHGREQLAVLFVDLDGFKGVNDTLGHQAGDLLLGEMAERLRRSVRDNDLVARIGGDEFAILAAIEDTVDSVHALVERIAERMREPVAIRGQATYLSASIGIAIGPVDGTDGEALLKRADAAMYTAKRRGGGYEFFTPDIDTLNTQRFELENAVRRAVDQDEFLLYYQPQVDVLTGEVRAVEALLRWQRAHQDLVSPGVFIPVLEETRLIIPLGRWVIREACAQLATWRAAGYAIPKVTVNVASIQLESPGFVDMVREALVDHGLAPSALEIEIVETSLIRETQEVAELLKTLSAIGVGIALDDFGTGFSALDYLRLFPISTLKLDRAFVQGCTADESGRRLAEAVIAMMQKLDVNIIAEGVETRDQLDLLHAQGCYTIQGFLICPPVDPMGIHRFLDRKAAQIVPKEGATGAAPMDR